MGIAKLYSQSGGSGFKINGITQSYYVATGETVNKGDFIELVETENETQVRKATTADIYGVSKSSGVGGDKINVYVLATNTYTMADGNILTTSNGDVFLLKEAI